MVMTMDKWNAEAARLLPCECDKIIIAEFGHVCEPCKHRSAVAAALEKAAEKTKLYKKLWEEEKEVYKRSVGTENQLRAEVARLTEQNAAAVVQGLEIAIDVCDGLPDGLDCTNAIADEIAKRKKNT